LSKIIAKRDEANFMKGWHGQVLLKKIARVAAYETHRRKKESEYFSKVAWTVVKMMAKLKLKVRKWGPTNAERVRQ